MDFTKSAEEPVKSYFSGLKFPIPFSLFLPDNLLSPFPVSRKEYPLPNTSSSLSSDNFHHSSRTPHRDNISRSIKAVANDGS
jgi:hypothetical protein